MGIPHTVKAMRAVATSEVIFAPLTIHERHEEAMWERGERKRERGLNPEK